MALVKAKLTNVSVDPSRSINVLFNPTEYGEDLGASYAELQVPGLSVPILQFVRGEARTLSLELFLDGTNKREGIKSDLENLLQFVMINSELYAPPVCRFEWGSVSFQGVVTSLKQKHSLFDEAGQVLRTRVTLTLKSYESAEVQLRELSLLSPDRTRVRVLREGETLDNLANEVYGNPRLWRVIADANNIDRPRFVPVGTPLRIPAL